MEQKIVYFEEPGRINTVKTLALAKKRAVDLGIENIVIATTIGLTPRTALKVFKDTKIKIIIAAASRSKIPTDLIEESERHGYDWFFCDEINYNYPMLAIDTLRRFCEGMKVCVEIVMIATDAGYISEGEEVIAVAGTGYINFEEKGGGADTAIVIDAMKSDLFFIVRQGKEGRRKIKEILCKPR